MRKGNNKPGNHPQPFGYTGYRREETKGSYHGGARIYQAGTGTFTAKDDNRYINPLNPRTLNLYQYCQGNPMAYTDPTGHEALMEGSQIADLILYCPESLEKTYLERTLECLLLNNFSKEVTGAGIGIKVGLGVAGVDLPFDIVNIIADLCQYDDLKYKTRQEWWGNFALDILAFAPLIGLEKYAKYLTDAKAVFKPVMKKAGEIGEIIRSTGRKISGMDDVGEAGAKQLDGGKISTSSPKNLIGKDFEDYLTKEIGGNGSFSAGGRDFDGGVGNRWWEAKSGQYWDMLESNPDKLVKFKSDMGDRLKIAQKNGATYELYSNTSIPQSIKDWLIKKEITFTELLD